MGKEGSCEQSDLPLTYFRFSSSFICSARSSVGGTWGVVVGGVGFGVPLEDVGPEARFLRGDPSARRVDPSAVWVTTGESVMAGVRTKLKIWRAVHTACFNGGNRDDCATRAREQLE
jgi:hypothetical protein